MMLWILVIFITVLKVKGSVAAYWAATLLASLVCGMLYGLVHSAKEEKDGKDVSMLDFAGHSAFGFIVNAAVLALTTHMAAYVIAAVAEVLKR